MRCHQWFARGSLALGLVVLTTGCEKKTVLLPVEGKIRFANGNKLPAGTRLIFNPSEGGRGTAIGVTARDGSFKVTHVSGGDGVEAGQYTVVLAAPEGDKGDFFRAVPKEYCDGGGLTVEIAEGMVPLMLQVKTN